VRRALQVRRGSDQSQNPRIINLGGPILLLTLSVSLSLSLSLSLSQASADNRLILRTDSSSPMWLLTACSKPIKNMPFQRPEKNTCKNKLTRRNITELHSG
jgi:hypothetical protein